MFSRRLLSTRLGSVNVHHSDILIEILSTQITIIIFAVFCSQQLLHSVRLSQKTHFKPVIIMDGDSAAVRPNPIVTRLESAEFKSIFNPSLYELIDIFKRNNYELRIAGGAVR